MVEYSGSFRCIQGVSHLRKKAWSKIRHGISYLTGFSTATSLHGLSTGRCNIHAVVVVPVENIFQFNGIAELVKLACATTVTVRKVRRLLL